MKRFQLISFVFIAVMLATGLNAYAGEAKVAICHITGTYDFGEGEVPIGHVISIADSAYQSHIDHGDPEAWTMAQTDEGETVCTCSLCPSLASLPANEYPTYWGDFDWEVCNPVDPGACFTFQVEIANTFGSYDLWSGTAYYTGELPIIDDTQIKAKGAGYFTELYFNETKIFEASPEDPQSNVCYDLFMEKYNCYGQY